MARKVGLDRRQVIDAADALADAEGLENVSLTRVAEALSVSSPSLYSHVDGLGALRRELALEASTRLGAALRDAVTDGEGVEALRSVAHVYRAFARTHPGLYATLHTTPRQGDDPGVFAAFGALVSDLAPVLTGLGLPDHDRCRSSEHYEARCTGSSRLRPVAGSACPTTSTSRSTSSSRSPCPAFSLAQLTFHDREDDPACFEPDPAHDHGARRRRGQAEAVRTTENMKQP